MLKRPEALVVTAPPPPLNRHHPNSLTELFTLCVQGYSSLIQLQVLHDVTQKFYLIV
jgi:hypothetical protein